jgi:AcrR family transcriptional regulator
MDDVASEAELGKGTLYLYFKNKDELILALAMRMRMRMIDGFDEAIQEAETGLELLEGITRSYCTIVEGHRDLFMLSFHVMAAGFDLDPTTPTYALWRESGEWSLRIVINAIERGRRDGSIRPDLDAPMVAVHMFSGMFGATLVQYGGMEEREKSDEVLVDPGRILSSFAEFFIDSIKNKNGDRKGA